MHATATTTTARHHGAAPADRVRQIVVAVSAVLAVVGAFIGSGAAGGTPIQNAAGGALSADATPIAPAGPAFSIWSVIYTGLIAYAVWQLLPGQAARSRHRRLGYLIAASLLLNAAWILSVQAGLLALSGAVIVALLAVLIVTFVRTVRSRAATDPVDAPHSRLGRVVEAVVLDGTVGLYLGWVCVATAANLTSVLMAAGFDGFGASRDAWGVAVVIVAGLAGLALAVFGRGRIAPALSLAWGLAWVAVGRTTGELVSEPVAIAATITAVALLVATVLIRIVELRSTRAGRVDA